MGRAGELSSSGGGKAVGPRGQSWAGVSEEAGLPGMGVGSVVPLPALNEPGESAGMRELEGSRVPRLRTGKDQRVSGDFLLLLVMLWSILGLPHPILLPRGPWLPWGCARMALLYLPSLGFELRWFCFALSLLHFPKPQKQKVPKGWEWSEGGSSGTAEGEGRMQLGWAAAAAWLHLAGAGWGLLAGSRARQGKR